MYFAELSIECLGKRNDDEATYVINDYCSALRQNGQLMGDEWSITYKDQSYRVHVKLAERDSLRRKYCNEYWEKNIQKLKESNLKKPQIINIAREVSSSQTSKPEKNDFFILSTDYKTLESPILGGTDFLPIPLYYFPKTYHDEYYDIICWRSNFIDCDRLQMNCSVAERSSINQISNISSNLNKEGLEICARLSKMVGKPFYYHLLALKAKSIESEQSKACPKCGNPSWKLGEPLFERFEFKCDKCKILSNIAIFS